MMIKITREKQIVGINEYIPSYDKNIERINPKVLLDDFHEWLLVESMTVENLMIPVNLTVFDLLQNINEVEFEFIKCNCDCPIPEDGITRMKFDDLDIWLTVNIMFDYFRYQLINYLPYTDFAIDNMPMLNRVFVNGKPSNVFDDIGRYIVNAFINVDKIFILKTGEVKYIKDTDINKVKKARFRYLRVNDNSPLFYKTYKDMYRAINHMSHIEVTLRWYKKEDKDYLSSYTDSVADDYLYSSTGTKEILTLQAVLNYLINYYKTELRYMRDNNFLIITICGYFKYHDKLYGYQTHITDKTDNTSYIYNGILQMLANAFMMYSGGDY